MTFEEWFCKYYEISEHVLHHYLKNSCSYAELFEKQQIAWNAAKEDSKPIAYIYCFDGFWYTAQSPEFDTKEKAIEWAIENGYRLEESQ